MIIYIYRLIDPFTLDTRYVGKAVNLERRFKAHISRCKRGKYHSALWIKGLLNKGKRPIIEVIEECAEADWQDREKYWIERYRKDYDLTNISSGGEGGASYGRLGKPWSDEHRKNNKKARFGKTVNHTAEGDKNRASGIRRFYANNKKVVIQYDLDGIFVKEWESSVDAGKELSINYSNINKNCNGLRNKAGGYLWKFKE